SPLALGLAAAWHFNQGSSPVNLANPALNGAYQGAPILAPTEDGAGMAARSAADYLLVPDPNNLLNFTTGSFSIAAGFSSAVPMPGVVLCGRNPFTAAGYDIQIATEGVGKRIATVLSHAGTADIVQTGEVLIVGAINRVLITYGGSTATIYVNGVSQAS